VVLLAGLTLVTSSVFAAGQQAGGAAPGAATAPSGTGEAVSVNDDGTVNNPEAVAVDKTKLVFWSLFSGGDGGWMDQIIAKYNTTSPVKQVQSIMLVWADYYIKLETAVAARKGPDIGVSHVSRLPELVEQGIVIPVDDYAAKAGVNWNDYNPSMVNSITFNGKKYAIPLDTHAEIMYLNKDILAGAGVSLDSNGLLSVANWNEFKTVLDKIKPTLKSGQSTIALTNTGDDPYRVWWAVYFQMGGTPLINDAGNQVTLDKNTAVKAADFVKSMWTDGYILPGITDHGGLFRAQNAAICWAGTWETGSNTNTKGLNFVAQPFPRFFGTNDACWADAHLFVIPAKQSRSDADTQAAVNFAYWGGTKGAPTWAGSGQIPSYKPVLSSPDFTSLPYRTGYSKAASTAVLPPQSNNFGKMKDSMIRNLDLVWTGQASSSTAIDTICNDIADALK